MSTQHDDVPHDDFVPETYYVWKEWNKAENRLTTPWCDPDRYEFPMDLMFDSPESARQGKVEYEAEDWILCKETLIPIKGS